MPTLTSKQRNFLQILVRYLRDHGSPPTIRELQDAAELQSSRSVVQYLDALEAAGVIVRGEGARNIRLVTPSGASDTVRVPVIGRVAAGQPILAEEHVVDEIPVARTLARGAHRYYFLEVHGDSMDLAGIHDGDFVLVRYQESADDLSTVIALIDDSATVKILRRTSGAAILQPSSSNPMHRPIVVDAEFRIQGVVVATFQRQQLFP